jgi:hypothetical protein
VSRQLENTGFQGGEAAVELLNKEIIPKELSAPLPLCYWLAQKKALLNGSGY